MLETKTKVESVLRALIDPEAGINIIDLGLLESVNFTGQSLTIELVPTTAGCPLLDALSQGAIALLSPHFPDIEIKIEWNLDKTWTPDRMKDV